MFRYEKGKVDNGDCLTLKTINMQFVVPLFTSVKKFTPLIEEPVREEHEQSNVYELRKIASEQARV